MLTRLGIFLSHWKLDLNRPSVSSNKNLNFIVINALFRLLFMVTFEFLSDTILCCSHKVFIDDKLLTFWADSSSHDSLSVTVYMKNVRVCVSEFSLMSHSIYYCKRIRKQECLEKEDNRRNRMKICFWS